MDAVPTGGLELQPPGWLFPVGWRAGAQLPDQQHPCAGSHGSVTRRSRAGGGHVSLVFPLFFGIRRPCVVCPPKLGLWSGEAELVEKAWRHELDNLASVRRPLDITHCTHTPLTSPTFDLLCTVHSIRVFVVLGGKA